MIKKIYKFTILRLEYWVLTILNYIIPKNNKSVFIFDMEFKKDNVWSVANYLANEEIGKKYTIYYYTKSSEVSFLNIVFVRNSILALWKQLRSKYIFYSYRGDGVKTFRSARGQTIIDTMHGSPLKRIGYKASNSKFNKLWRYETTFDYILCVSDFFKPIIKDSFGTSENQCIILGYPRNDIIFKKKCVLANLGIDKGKYSKVLLWVPTWRASRSVENNSESDKDYPILNLDNIEYLNNYLNKSKILLIIKPHPYQLNLEIFNNNSSNIKIIKNQELNREKVEFYQLFHEIDALLTDYSSVYFDFLLTMKPIGFTIDDFDSYEDKRGFVVDNPLDIMPGEKITNINELINFFNDIKNENDKYYDERKKVNDLVNKYKDGNSAKRFVEYLKM